MPHHHTTRTISANIVGVVKFEIKSPGEALSTFFRASRDPKGETKLREKKYKVGKWRIFLSIFHSTSSIFALLEKFSEKKCFPQIAKHI